MTDYLTDDWPSAPPMTALVNRVLHTDALSLLAMLPSASVDAFITDLPYGTTACSWDEIIPFAPMWAAVKRTLKPRGVFVTTASQPFTSKLVMSNVSMFKYSWVWDKSFAGNFVTAEYQPMKTHEDICVFSVGQHNYYPQMITRQYSIKGGGMSKTNIINNDGFTALKKTYTDKYPITILNYPRDLGRTEHPTQKPIELVEYLIRTYTQPNALVVDFCCGSGTTALAARNLDRRFIVGDITPEYVAIARNRLAQPFTPRLPFAS